MRAAESFVGRALLCVLSGLNRSSLVKPTSTRELRIKVTVRLLHGKELRPRTPQIDVALSALLFCCGSDPNAGVSRAADAGDATAKGAPFEDNERKKPVNTTDALFHEQ
ncbi:hypothetical protein EVAR_29202_1 [Eumeta japonica]|uniref:Uncharacterized protein n=1 Tax=Eumeta variegata TaxID=151549 RepID=A0A4C1VI44_EUMVA|nr:hypothetical protein EVAR_29202_1 [Eumeta japonica]